MKTYTQRIAELYRLHEELITRTNIPQETSNGIFTRYKYPVLTAAHTPVFWRYDLDEKQSTSPYNRCPGKASCPQHRKKCFKTS